MVQINQKALRDKKAMREEVTRNFLILTDFVVGKTGPIKTYSAWSKLVGIAKSNFTDMHQGKRAVPMEAAIRACDLTGCAYSWMFSSKGDMFGKDEAMSMILNLEDRVSTLETLAGIKKKKK